MSKQNLMKSLLVLGVTVAVGLCAFGVVKAAAYLGQNAKIVVTGPTTINVADAGQVVSDKGAFLGSAQTTAAHTNDANVTTNLDSLFLWGTGSNGGLEVDGTAWLTTVNVSGTTQFAGSVAFTGTGTPTGVPAIAYAVGGTATTTVCSIQNTSGVARIIPKQVASVNVDIAPNGGQGVVAPTLTFGVTSTAQGTPATGSGYAGLIFAMPLTTSTAAQTVVTTTVGSVVWPVNYFLVLKASATTTQTMNCSALISLF